MLAVWLCLPRARSLPSSVRSQTCKCRLVAAVRMKYDVCSPLPLLLQANRSKSRLTSLFFFSKDEGIDICSTHLPFQLSKGLGTSPLSSPSPPKSRFGASIDGDVVRGAAGVSGTPLVAIQKLIPALDAWYVRQHAWKAVHCWEHLVSWAHSHLTFKNGVNVAPWQFLITWSNSERCGSVRVFCSDGLWAYCYCNSKTTLQ